MARRISVVLGALFISLVAAVPAVAQTGTISGTVTNAAGGAPIQGVSVVACNGDSCFQGVSGFTNSSGQYTITGLSNATYRVYTSTGYTNFDSNTGGVAFIDQFYRSSPPTVECGGCRPTLSTGSTITVSGSPITGINFALRQGPRILGRVTNSAGVGVANVNVVVHRVTGSWIGPSFVQTDSNGDFESGGLPPGIPFTVLTVNSGLVDEIYDNIPCIGGSCSLSSGGSITFATDTSPNVTVNFSLADGGRIAGTVTNRAGGSPVPFASLSFYNGTGVQVAFASADSSGNYLSPGLPAGSYFVKAQTFGSPSFIGQIYNDIACAPCDVTSGTPVAVTVGSTTSSINFALDEAGSISGNITDASTLAGIQNASISVYTTGGVFVSSGFTGSSSAGAYSVSGLPTGNYVLLVSVFNGNYIPKLYTTAGGINCSNCDVTGGSPVAVSLGSPTTGINVALSQGGTVTGTVTAASGGAPIAGLNVTVMTPTGGFAGSDVTDASGVYSIGGLVAGTYYVRTNSSSTLNFIPEIFAGVGNHVTCVSCPVTSGTGLTVALGGSATADFSLLAGASISGTVTDGSAPIQANFAVQLFNNINSFSITSVSTNSAGQFVFAGLPAGTYFVKTNMGQGRLDEVYNDILCVGCTASGGTPIVLAAGEARTGIDFALGLGGRITGRITDAAGNPLASGQAGFVGVSVFNAGGAFVSSASTNSAGVFLTSAGLPNGTYFVASSNSLGYINTLYNGISCVNCFAPSGTGVPVTVGNTTAGIDLVLTPGGRISGNVKTSDGAGGFIPVANAQVQVYSSSGSFVSSATTNSAGNYAVVGLATNNYFVKTGNGVGFIDELFANAICVGCDVTTGTPVPVTVGSNTTGIDFVLDPGGAISGTVRDGSSAPIAGVSVQVYNSFGGFVGSVQTQSDGSYTLRGLATGSYFARTFNSLGFINVVKGSPDIVCGSCSVTNGTPIAVTVGSTTSGQDFVLNLGATIRGQVLNGTTPIAGVSISVVNPSSNGAFVGSALTDSLGNYTVSGIIPGTFLVKTFNSQGFIDEVYDNVECVGCTATNGQFITITTAGQLVTGIDFVLGTGGRIRGTVLDSASNPIAGINVEVYRTNGTFATATSTNSRGEYVSSAGLPAGSYYVRTRNSLGYVDRVYSGITCVGCIVTSVSGTVVTLAAGASLTQDGETEASAPVTSASNIDFALALGGSISGTVTKSDGTPIQNAFVQVYTEAGTFITSTGTNGLGRYLLKGLPTGNYFARTSNSLGYIDQLYNGVTCTSCNVTTGQPIAVTVGNVTPNIDFALVTGGRVTGTVTAAAGGAPIGSVSVQIYNATGGFVTSGFTSPSGVYITGGLPTGQYFARTFNSLGFINMLHASPTDIICASCTVTSGTPFTVTVGASTTVNFSLPVGGAISGTVTVDGSSTPIAGVNVQVSTATGAFIGSANTNAAGVYTVGGLPTGSYTIRTFNSSGYVDELYDNVACLSCSVSAGAQVSVTVGATTGNINFGLTQGGLVSGTVVDSAGNGIPNVSVQFFTPANFFVTSITTDNLGRYTTRAGMPTGTYFARTSNSVGFINVTYPSNTCLNCPISSGSPIAVTAGQTTPNINFTLTLGGRITGTITDATTGLPLQGVSVSFFLADGSGVGGGGTNSLGVFSSAGLPAGTYYARTNNGLGYVNQVYNNVPCVRCFIASGQPITVTTGNTTSNINFALSPGGRISGVVTDAATGNPLASATVQVYDANGFFATGAFTNALGQYTTTGGLLSGSYYVRTFNGLGYVNKLYDVFTCLQCNPTTGVPVAVTVGTTTSNINFALSAGGRIAGTVTAAGVGLADAFVDVYTSGGTYITSARTGSGGQYITGEGLTAGTYYLISFNNAGFIDELYNNNQCGFTCAVTSGQGVVVSATGTTSGIDFDLAAGARIAGRVTSSVTGGALPNVPIRIFNSTGALVATGFSDGLGNYLSGGLKPGSYFAQTNATSRSLQHVNKAYNNIACAGCDPLTGTPIVASGSATTAGIDFMLDAGSVISGTVTNAATGLPIAAANVQIFNADGRLVANGNTNDAGDYATFTAVPAGTYFARTANGLGFVDRLYDTDVCLACDPTRGTPIVVDGTNPVGGINFALTAGGRIAGTVTASAGGAAIAGSKVRFFNSAGSFLGQSFTNGVGAYVSPGLPPGNYFVRTANTGGFVDELYLDAPCSPCNLSQGTAVTIVTAGLRTGIDFALDAGGLVSGYVTDQVTGSPIRGVTLSVYRASDGVLVATTDPTDANGYYQISLPVGTYQVEPNPVAGFRPALTGLRGPLARSTVTVGTDTETTGIGFALVACTPITVNPSTLPLAAQGQLYSSTFTASGGSGSYTFSVTDGAVNTGLALNSAGLLAGAPVFAGTGNFTVAAMDSNQCAGSRAFALTACTFFLSTPSLSTTANAGSGTVQLTASAADCPWVITTSDSWITVTSAPNGTGNATVAFSYAFNTTGAARSGTLLIGGQTFTITQSAPTSTAAFGAVDTPADGATGISGSLGVTGWALDDIEVKRVTISRTGLPGEPAAEIYIGDATLVEGARPDVAATYPTLPFKTRAGWGYLMLTNMLPNLGNGSFTLHIDAIDAEGSVTRLGSRTFVADNANAITPFGAIDTPPQGGTVSGTMTNFGWVLSRGAARADPPSGGNVRIVIDGVFQATVPSGWTTRSDLASLFPASEYSGIVNALGVAAFDSTTLANGVHTISWVVTDNAGQASGIGSRYFTINNILASQRFAPPPLASMRAQASTAPQGPPVSLRVGFDKNQPMVELGADSLGGRFVAVGQLGLMELRFGQACGVVKGVQIANGERTPLPIGTTLDASGSFHWMPGPAFLGTYQLEFSVPSCDGTQKKIPVTIAVLPGR